MYHAMHACDYVSQAGVSEQLFLIMSVMSVQELLDKCHPLGMFDSIATLAVASSMRELYRLVLVDTPLAPYFSESLSAGESSFPCVPPLRLTTSGSCLSSGCSF